MNSTPEQPTQFSTMEEFQIALSGVINRAVSLEDRRAVWEEVAMWAADLREEWDALRNDG